MDIIIDEHAEMRRQAEKRRVNPVRPKLAMAYQQMAEDLESLDPKFAKQLRDLVVLHRTGKVPEGLQLRQGAFKHA